MHLQEKCFHQSTSALMTFSACNVVVGFIQQKTFCGVNITIVTNNQVTNKSMQFVANRLRMEIAI